MTGGKIVDFSKCMQCKHWTLPESEDPCWDCLQHGYRMFSKTPLYFVKREESDQNERKRK